MTDRIETTRRGALGAIAVGAAAATGAIPAAAQGAQKTFVLVHGALHGGWCWRRVADLLEKKGHKVFAPTLTGLGACSHLLSKDVNLTTHVTDVVNLIKWENLSDVVLVGHSYGGLHHQRRRREDRRQARHRSCSSTRSCRTTATPSSTRPRRSSSEVIAAALARGDVSLKAPPPAAFRVNEADRAWVDGKCTPHPIGTLTDKITLTGGRDKIAKKTYIRANGYPSIPFDGALAKVKGIEWKTFEMTAGHDAMVDQPQELTDILLQVA